MSATLGALDPSGRLHRFKDVVEPGNGSPTEREPEVLMLTPGERGSVERRMMWAHLRPVGHERVAFPLVRRPDVDQMRNGLVGSPVVHLLGDRPPERMRPASLDLFLDEPLQCRYRVGRIEQRCDLPGSARVRKDMPLCRRLDGEQGRAMGLDVVRVSGATERIVRDDNMGTDVAKDRDDRFHQSVRACCPKRSGC